MARKNAPGTLIHCEVCHEDYSATYKRCPFCGEKSGQWSTSAIPTVSEEYEDDYVFDGGGVFDDNSPASSQPRGGKRLSDDAPGPINWPRIVTFICALIIIAAALVIVFSYIYPKIHTSNPGPDTSDVVSDPPASSDPVHVETRDPDDVETYVPGQDEEPDSTAPATPGAATGITLSKTDFTLTPNESWTIKATVTPEDWNGTVTWTSSNTRIATVSADGTVTNVNTSSQLLSVTITATAGDLTATAKVYCRGGSTPSTDPDDEPSGSGSTELTLNKEDFTLYVNGSASNRTTTMKVTSGDTNVVWSISDTSVATIDENGKVTAVGKGKATITATAPDGSTATCIVRVRES